MNKHMSKDMYNACKQCIDKCKSTVEQSKNLLASCKIADVPAKCMIDINSAMITTDECIAACEIAMDHCNRHMKECSDQDCKRVCEKVIYNGKECIKACDDIEVECDHDLNPCIDAVQKSIDKCKDCIQACNNCIDVLSKK